MIMTVLILSILVFVVSVYVLTKNSYKWITPDYADTEGARIKMNILLGSALMFLSSIVSIYSFTVLF